MCQQALAVSSLLKWQVIRYAVRLEEMNKQIDRYANESDNEICNSETVLIRNNGIIENGKSRQR